MIVFVDALIGSEALRERYDAGRWVVLDCRFTLGDPAAGETAYRAAHIPGAQYVDLDRHLSGPVSDMTGRHPLPDPRRFAKLVGALGISRESQVVVYDDCGGAMAARAWFLLRWLGHKPVALLDGGLQSWTDAGFELSSDVQPSTEQSEYPADIESQSIATTADVAALISGSGGPMKLVDARAPERFDGVHEPIDHRAGHIPGALNRPYTENLQPNGRFKPAQLLRQEWTQLLDSCGAIVMCGSGVTACHHVLALTVAGSPDGRLYAGSWSEWIQDRSRPVFQQSS